MKTLTLTRVLNSLTTANTTTYLDPVFLARSNTGAGAEAVAQFKFPFAGTIRKLRVVVASNARTTNVTVRLRKNGANGNLNVVIAGGTTGVVSDTSNSDAIAAGDLICLSAQTLTGTQALNIQHIQFEFEAADGKSRYSFCYAGLRTLSLFAAATLYGPACGSARTVVQGWGSTDNADVRTRISAAATISHARIEIPTNTLNASAELELFKNGVATGLIVTVPAATTGWFENSATTVSVSPGDYINWQYRSSRTSGNLGMGHLELSLEDTGNEQWQIVTQQLENANPLVNATTSRWTPIGGWTLYETSSISYGLILEEDLTATRMDYYCGPNWSAGGTTLQHSGVDTALAATHTGAISGTPVTSTIPAALLAGDYLSAKMDITTGTNSRLASTITIALGPSSSDAFGSGPIGTVTLSAPTGSAITAVVGSGPIGTISLVAPEGGLVLDVVGEGPIGTIVVSPPRQTMPRLTQFGADAIAMGEGDLRTTQAGIDAVARITANGRVTQMGLLVIAKGGETPLVPDPLKLQDGGREELLVQRLVNMYVETTPEGPVATARFQRPGLYTLAERGGGPVRATFLHKGFRYTISGGLVWRDNTNIGEVPEEGQLRWAISDDEVVVVAGDRAYYVTLDEVARINDPDLPRVRDVKFLSGRFIYFASDTSGMYFYSDVNDARSIDGLSFASAEANPDRIIGAEVLGEGIAIFGTNTTEWHYPTLDPNNPFQRSQGRTYDKGCTCIQTVQLADNSLYFVGNDRMVYRAAQVPAKVSTPRVDNWLRKQTPEQFESNSAFVITFGGHTFYVLNIVGFGTWAFDVGPKLWAEWRTWGMDRFRVSVADADGFMGDAVSGRIMGFDGKRMTDLDGDPIERIVSTWQPLPSGTMRNFSLALHTRQGVGLLGVEDHKGGDPKVEMRFSDHLGQNWSNWLEGNLGKHGVRGKEAMAQWTNLGTFPSPGRAFEFRCTDPVEFTPFMVSINEWRP